MTKSYYGSILGAAPTSLQYKSNPIHDIYMTHEVDGERLQQAVDKAAQVCPYVLLNVCKSEDGRFIYYEENHTPIVVRAIRDDEEFGESYNNGHYTSVTYSGNLIRLVVCHAITDGTGTKWFMDAVFAYYTGKGVPVYDGANKPDSAVDLMADPLTVDPSYVPRDWSVSENQFHFPEAAMGDTKRQVCLMTFDKGGLETAAKQMGASLHRFTCIAVGLTIQKMYPDNRKNIVIRSPFDTRNILNAPNTFQNASIPHIFMEIDNELLINGEYERLSGELNRQCKAEMTYDNFAYITNKFAELFKAGDAKKMGDFYRTFVHASDIIISNLGHFFGSEYRDDVEKVYGMADSAYPVMLYINMTDDKVIFNLGYKLISDEFERTLIEVLGKLGVDAPDIMRRVGE